MSSSKYVKYEAAVSSGSVWALPTENGRVRTMPGVKLESSGNMARNQFGYAHTFTWAEAHKMGIVIWVEDNGEIWCEDRS